MEERESAKKDNERSVGDRRGGNTRIKRERGRNRKRERKGRRKTKNEKVILVSEKQHTDI